MTTKAPIAIMVAPILTRIDILLSPFAGQELPGNSCQTSQVITLRGTYERNTPEWPKKDFFRNSAIIFQ
jgi:hypothetical protein